MKIIIVLGSPNDPDGSLSKIAESRLSVCQEIYESGLFKIVLTGGFGAHFNTSDKAHAYYLKQHLTANGIAPEDILALIESRHSVEDATLSQWIIARYKPEKIIIVTSDYHFKRAEIIFKAVYFPFTDFSFSLASSKSVNRDVLNLLIQHEETAVQDLLDHGVRF